MQRFTGVAQSFMNACEAIAPVAGVEMEDLVKKTFNRPAQAEEMFQFKLLMDGGFFSNEGVGPKGTPLYQLTWKGYALLQAMRRNENV